MQSQYFLHIRSAWTMCLVRHSVLGSNRGRIDREAGQILFLNDVMPSMKDKRQPKAFDTRQKTFLGSLNLGLAGMLAKSQRKL